MLKSLNAITFELQHLNVTNSNGSKTFSQGIYMYITKFKKVQTIAYVCPYLQSSGRFEWIANVFAFLANVIIIFSLKF